MAGSLFVNSLIFQVTVCVVLFSETYSYKELLLEDAKICKLQEDADESVIKVSKTEAKIITQHKYLASWSGRYNFICSFMVRSPSSYGLYGVVQVLNFRKHNTTQKCKDYVRFEEPRPKLLTSIFRTKPKSQKQFCGRIYAGQDSPSSSEDIYSQNGFVSQDGEIQVTIYVGTERLQPNERLDIKIAFTAFKHDCKTVSESISCRHCEWIWQGFENDKVQNCPYTSCEDENGCTDLESPFTVRDVVSTGTGTKFTVGVVATIILIFLMFATCLWVCRKSQRCLWSPNNNSNSRMEMNRTRSPSRPEDNTTSYGDLPPDVALPSAPPLSETEVKDLPPSYDSLFPAK